MAAALDGLEVGENLQVGPASSFAALRTRYWMLDDTRVLDAILEDTSCLRFIAPED